ncbi:Oidioi.mRNA.OKI2018_I69.chr1.g83.t1.cds [Oikopleura dioica]|uniref:Oidioi.mRNA.OKI2018_I69.chr1.g83.t1.cds n=1 Tax=Oikopleura dioica TaxID=34765 RepID=A0ABN7SMK9_OIKDI|nr:Oidioi.mRNA.OKI2018_I69.chr1.g83.t1.cds [Oikopleura dioica]
MSKKHEENEPLRDLHGNVENTKENITHVAETAADVGLLRGTQEAVDEGSAEEQQARQADAVTGVSNSPYIRDWFDRLITWLPQEQFNNIKNNVSAFINDGVSEEKTGEKKKERIFENAKTLIERVSSEFGSDGSLTKLQQFSLMIILHKMIAKELANQIRSKLLDMRDIARIYLKFFKDFLVQLLFGFNPDEFRQIWDATIVAVQNFGSIRMCVAVVVVSYACFYLFNNYFRK